MHNRRTARKGFTVTEMMVATALILVIVVIIAQAFGSASKTYRKMRTVGEMQERLRGGSSILRRDLAAEHFNGPFVAGISGPRVGDQRLDLVGWTPPTEGYFEIIQLGPSFAEPAPTPMNPTATAAFDAEGLTSTRADRHSLRFTVRLPDGPGTELFSAKVPLNAPADFGTNPKAASSIVDDYRMNAFPYAATADGVAYTRWAEIHYFLDLTTDTTTPTGLPVFSLRRRVRLLASERIFLPATTVAAASALILQYPDVAMTAIASPTPGQVIPVVLSAAEVTDPQYRVPFQQITRDALNVPTGGDILITDVLSFEVKAAWFNNPSFNVPESPFSSLPTGGMFNTTSFGTINPDAPFDDLRVGSLNLSSVAGNRAVFDTWYRPATNYDWDLASGELTKLGFLRPGSDQVPNRINVRAVQIKIRVWDAKANEARQITVVQEI